MVASLICLFVALLSSKISNTEAWVTTFPGMSVTSPLSVPRCKFTNDTAACCTRLSVMTVTQLCGGLEVNLNQLNVITSLFINGEPVIERTMEFGKLCGPVGGPTPVIACLHFYWVEIGPQKNGMKFNICFQGSVNNLATVDFQCLRYENGKFSRNSDHSPREKGIVNIRLPK